jgi:hypothetical protein
MLLFYGKHLPSIFWFEVTLGFQYDSIGKNEVGRIDS